ncbi:MAG: hypothetical protein F6K19_08645 [Cyanothece sp. SIO1E1]|nr:hypothetical protein [Cyanothece sp. SIO1E1]
MAAPKVLFINCTLKPSPELSNTEALWQLVADLYHQKGCPTQQLRTVDFQILPGTTLEAGPGDAFPQVFGQIQTANILIVGIPVQWGNRSSEYQKLIERLQATCQAHIDPATGQSPLYNKVFGLVLVGDAAAGSHCSAQTCYDFNQLGCINPPNNTVSWFQPLDTTADFIEAEGKQSITVNRQARLLVENSVAIAHLLRQTPLITNLQDVTKEVRAIAKAATVETATLMTAKAIRTEENPDSDGIDYHHITKRIWTVMQAGMQRGFTFKILSLEDRIFRAERDGKGFIYKIYPGHFSFRSQYQDYDYEQSKSHKLELLGQQGLPVPMSYGTFKTVAEIPFDQLSFPIVAKPDSGSLSQNVFPNLQNVDQLKQAATTIAAHGGVIKLESHISGRDYRVLILNHQYAGCVERRPANVIGDGQHTILELFHQRNQEPGRGDRHEAHTTIHQLVFDQTSRRRLHAAGHTLETVLPEGKIFYLQEKITASTGADYVDHTDQLHPSISQSCIEFSYRFSTLTLGFDLITTDISRPLVETGGAFNEYNFLPYVDLHENCNVGQKRPVCRLIWDHIEAHAERIVTSEFKPF